MSHNQISQSQSENQKCSIMQPEFYTCLHQEEKKQKSCSFHEHIPGHGQWSQESHVILIDAPLDPEALHLTHVPAA